MIFHYQKHTVLNYSGKNLKSQKVEFYNLDPAPDPASPNDAGSNTDIGRPHKTESNFINVTML